MELFESKHFVDCDRVLQDDVLQGKNFRCRPRFDWQTMRCVEICMCMRSGSTHAHTWNFIKIAMHIFFASLLCVAL